VIFSESTKMHGATIKIICFCCLMADLGFIPLVFWHPSTASKYNTYHFVCVSNVTNVKNRFKVYTDTPHTYSPLVIPLKLQIPSTEESKNIVV